MGLIAQLSAGSHPSGQQRKSMKSTEILLLKGAAGVETNNSVCEEFEQSRFVEDLYADFLRF